MNKKIVIPATIIALSASLFAGCGKTEDDGKVTDSTVQSVVVEESAKQESIPEAFPLEDGIYLVDFDTDNSMFHVNEVCEGKATLTVTEGKANLHLVMPSKNILNLYLGLAEEAQAEGAAILEPSKEEVTYSDGLVDTVYAFDVPVTVLGEFDLALIGKKGVWYDHKVSITNPVVFEDVAETQETEPAVTETVEVGEHTIAVSFTGGTGKVTLESPTGLTVTENGYLVTLIWSSKYYDYMIVDGEKYLPVDSTEHSVFEIPVSNLSEPLTVIADTVAMSTPHEIEYVLSFDTGSIQ